MEQAPWSWSNIPLELAGLLLDRLDAHVDRVNFAAVCTHWRFAAKTASLPPPLPLLALKDGSFYSMPRGEPLRFPGCGDDFVTASGNWLVYKRWNCLLLVNPFSRATMTLPAVPSNNYPDNMDFVRALGKNVGKERWHPVNMDFVVLKLVVCSPHLIAALFQGTTTFSIGVCRPGASSWSVARDLPVWIFDLAFYREKLYAVSYHQDLLALEINMDDNTGEPHVALGETAIKAGFVHLDQNFFRVLYLVESGGSLLMVHRRMSIGHIQMKGQIHTFAEQCEPELEVFEADFEKSQWGNMTTLGDNQVLFLGSCSRAISMPQCDSQGKRFWLLDDYKKDEFELEPFAVPCGTAARKFSCPLPKISWRSQYACTGAMWLFPSN